MLTKCASLFIDTGLRNVTLTSKAPESKLLRLSMEQELLEDKLYSLTAIVWTYSLSWSQTGFLSRVVAQAGKRDLDEQERREVHKTEVRETPTYYTTCHNKKSFTATRNVCVCVGGGPL